MAKLTPTAEAMLGHLRRASWANKRKPELWISRARMCDLTGMDSMTVHRAAERLQEIGLITVERREWSLGCGYRRVEDIPELYVLSWEKVMAYDAKVEETVRSVQDEARAARDLRYRLRKREGKVGKAC